jgi:hypothetical protein
MHIYRKTRILAYISIALLILWSAVFAITISVTGSWNLLISDADLDGPPGSDLLPEYESLSDTVIISVNNQHSINWEVDVRKSDINWHPDLHLFIRRTSSGSGNPRKSGIVGGLNYQEISNSDQRFFWGWGKRTNINSQLKISGISVSIPAETYTSIIWYTAIELY